MGELREVEAKLMEGSARAERLRRGGSAVSLCSPACGGRRRRSGVWGWGNGKRTRGTGCGASCSAAARERSRAGALIWACHGDGEVAAGGSIWARGRAIQAPARGVEERRELWRDAWEGHVKLEVAGLALSGGGSAASPALREEAGEQAGGRRSGLVCNFRNSRDPTVNQQ